jgi:hypothetical protein
MKKIWILILVLVLIILAAIAVLSRHPSTPVSATTGIATSEAPWPAELTHLKDRLTAIGLPALSAEGTALHIHQHLDIYVHGKRIDVPAGIGIHESFPPFISPIHVHDTTGIVHVESPTVQTFTLGEFFDIWGVRLSSACLGGYCADATSSLLVYVNGAPYTGDPRALALAAHQEIVIIYGTTAELPQPIPASYSFPQGY